MVALFKVKKRCIENDRKEDDGEVGTLLVDLPRTIIVHKSQCDTATLPSSAEGYHYIRIVSRGS